MERELSLVDYWRIVWKRKWIISAFIVITLTVTLIATLLAPKKYIASATIMPISSTGGTIASLLSATPFGNPVEQDARMMLVVLSSSSIAEDVIVKLDLLKKFGKGDGRENKMRLIKSLKKKIMDFSVTEDGAIVISAETEDPILSTELANIYIDELTNFLNKNSIATTFSVIDKASVPYTHDKPSIRVNLITAFAASLLIGFFYSLYDEHRERNYQV